MGGATITTSEDDELAGEVALQITEETSSKTGKERRLKERRAKDRLSPVGSSKSDTKKRDPPSKRGKKKS